MYSYSHELRHLYRDDKTIQLWQQANFRKQILYLLRAVTSLGTVGTFAFCLSLINF
jgi:hypothetical protein